MLGLGQSWSQSMVTEINPTVKQQRGLCWWDRVVYDADETNTIQEVQYRQGFTTLESYHGNYFIFRHKDRKANSMLTRFWLATAGLKSVWMQT